MLVMGVGMFVLLFFQLFDLQIVRHEELQSKAVNQQTRRTVVTASRGTIYDRSGNIMAISASAETVILSPLEIDRAVNDKDDPVTWTKDSLLRVWPRCWTATPPPSAAAWTTPSPSTS